MQKSTWSGSLGFGMVAIPVKLYGATDDKRKALDIHQYHSECRSRVKEPKYCSQCNKMLEPGDIIKGYELDEHNFVPLTESDYESLPLESLRQIQVDAFVKDLGDPRWIRGNIGFLSPEEVGAKAFVLFVKAMEEAGVMGIAQFTARKKEHLAAIRPFNGILLVQDLHWGDELREYGELVPFASVSGEEMEMAGKLVGGMTKDIDLTQYKDKWRDAMIDLIQRKLNGETIEPVAAPVPKQDADLAKQLMASLNAMEPSGTKS